MVKAKFSNDMLEYIKSMVGHVFCSMNTEIWFKTKLMVIFK